MINQILGGSATKPEVGMGASILFATDRRAATITEVHDDHIVVQNGYLGIVEIKVADADGFNVAWDATGKLTMNLHWRGEKHE